MTDSKVRRFKRRIAVHRGEAVFYVAQAAAMHLLDSGLAAIRTRTGEMISAISLTGAAIGWVQGQAKLDRLGLQPGSFGIRTESLDSGHLLYQHRNAWDQIVFRHADVPADHNSLGKVGRLPDAQAKY